MVRVSYNVMEACNNDSRVEVGKGRHEKKGHAPVYGNAIHDHVLGVSGSASAYMNSF